MNLLNVHTHLLHDFHTIAEREYDTFLCSTNQMSLIVLVEVQAVDGATYLLVLQHTFCTIAKWYHCHALTTNGYRSSQVVHLSITDLWSNISVCPCIQDTCAIDTEQHAESCLV